MRSISCILVGLIGFLIIVQIDCDIIREISSGDAEIDKAIPEEKEPNIWTILNPSTSVPCIRIQGDMVFQVLGEKHVGTIGAVKVPQDAIASGTCSSVFNTYQDIKLTWNSTTKDNLSIPLSIYFGFASNWESDFSDLSISPDEFGLNTLTVVYFGHTDHYSYPISYSVSDFISFLTPRGLSYSCRNIFLQQDDLILNISNFQMEAFSENIEPVLFNDEYSCSDVFLNNDEEYPYEGDKVEGSSLGSFVNVMKWIFIVFFGICLLGIGIILIMGLLERRDVIKDIGYRIVGTL